MSKVKVTANMTAKQLAEAIIEGVGKERIEEICDEYLLPTDEEDIITEKDVDWTSYNMAITPDWGGSEGIYLDVFLYGKGEKLKVFTGKTLREDTTAMRAMYLLAAEIRIATW